ncbi:hypothetical protein PV08_02615 [Exophiala spinifera]|uniref:Uncharacterized protein n=1 Tax=Exophiala spinifera TaxID=91928 RepID=A0A0D2A018_9EURO|nr:uncharacterized protein PV08_02615 [Exophiala spinifera]KIW18327.1 hypothetical protein PV08_02615 [Exophiala spinifera]
MGDDQLDESKTAVTAAMGPDDCFRGLLQYRDAHIVRVPTPNNDGEEDLRLPAADSISNQPAIDFHAELKHHLDHITAEADLDLCDPHRVEILDDLAADEDIIEPQTSNISRVDYATIDESVLDPFDDYTPGWEIFRKGAPRETVATDISAETVAYLFAEQAAGKLDPDDFRQLLSFLNQKPRSGDLGELKELTHKNLESFYDKNADLGLVLHVASTEDEIEGFWDVESRTIQLLIEKGVLDQDDFVFAFDWHWRAEGKRSKRKGPCPTTAWSRQLRLLHNTFSAALLEQLPLPLLIVSGACPVRQYWNTLPPAARHVELKISIPDPPGPNAEIVFYLDFRESGLRRIVACVDHPSAVFFRRQNYHVNIRLDAVFNFFLWLNGKNYDETTFTGRRAGKSAGLRCPQPWKELHEYNKKEKALGRYLVHSDYEQSFLLWARKYLEDDPSAILERGDSLAARVDHQFKKHVRLALAKRYGLEYAEYWHNKKPKVTVATGPTRIQLYIDPGKPALQLKGPWELGAMINTSLLDLTIKFRDDHVALYLGLRKVFGQSRKSLTEVGTQVTEWDQQFEKELRRSRLVGNDLEKQGSATSLLSESTRQTQAPATEVWVTRRNRGEHKHLHLCIRSKHLVGKMAGVEPWDGTCRTGCVLQEEQAKASTKMHDDIDNEQAKSANTLKTHRSDYHKAYYEANKEEKQAKNRAYYERNRAEQNEKAKIRMRALRQQRKAAFETGAAVVSKPNVD